MLHLTSQETKCLNFFADDWGLEVVARETRQSQSEIKKILSDACERNQMEERRLIFCFKMARAGYNWPPPHHEHNGTGHNFAPNTPVAYVLRRETKMEERVENSNGREAIPAPPQRVGLKKEAKRPQENGQPAEAKPIAASAVTEANPDNLTVLLAFLGDMQRLGGRVTAEVNIKIVFD